MTATEIPNEIHLTYRKVGMTHVFTAPDFPGFHVGSSSFRKGYDQAIKALGEHVSLLFNAPVIYDAETFEAFKKRLGAFIKAKKRMKQ